MLKTPLWIAILNYYNTYSLLINLYLFSGPEKKEKEKRRRSNQTTKNMSWTTIRKRQGAYRKSKKGQGHACKKGKCRITIPNIYRLYVWS